MMLEDHVGDVIHKARRTANVPEELASKTAGISVNDLANLEATGQIEKPVDWDRLAALVGLHGRKLALLASGWSPARVDLATWQELRQIITTQEGNTVNCYLAWDPATRQAALFDTGWMEAPVVELLQKYRLRLDHIFVTHHHHDHVAALDALRRHAPSVQFHSGLKSNSSKTRISPGDMVPIGNLHVCPRPTPGHSADSMIYLIENFPENAPPVAVVGDTLFAGSIGRGFQSADLLKTSIRAQIFSLPNNTLLCPGHGPLTTVGEQKDYNPFFG
ncbi:MAG TPA: MBL fold metallo-hydrolase [Candidatus Paceibacterota bacterium]|nr:MBL fold metallo-hydrolase [Candidatus Paceibacterota bacterium]